MTAPAARPTSEAIAIGAAASVAVAIAALAAFAVSTTLDLARDRAEVAALEMRLAEFAARRPAPAGEGIDQAASPLLDGATLTLAGAALQQRVEQAVARSGGTLSSSDVDLERPEAKDGVIALNASLEIPQPALQALLYDLEAGAPCLFVDKLSVQAPQAFGESEGGRMRVTLTVSGRWEAPR